MAHLGGFFAGLAMAVLLGALSARRDVV
jgi:membrane associated rhomboid family serine protease